MAAPAASAVNGGVPTPFWPGSPANPFGKLWHSPASSAVWHGANRHRKLHDDIVAKRAASALTMSVAMPIAMLEWPLPS